MRLDRIGGWVFAVVCVGLSAMAVAFVLVTPNSKPAASILGLVPFGWRSLEPLIADRRPGNSTAWLLLGAGFLNVLNGTALAYAVSHARRKRRASSTMLKDVSGLLGRGSYSGRSGHSADFQSRMMIAALPVARTCRNWTTAVARNTERDFYTTIAQLIPILVVFAFESQQFKRHLWGPLEQKPYGCLLGMVLPLFSSSAPCT